MTVVEVGIATALILCMRFSNIPVVFLADSARVSGLPYGCGPPLFLLHARLHWGFGALVSFRFRAFGLRR